MAAAFFEFDLVAHRRDRAGVGADEDDSSLAQRAGKGLAFAEEPVARMHRFGTGLAAGLDDLLHHEVAFGRRGRPDQHGIVGHFDVERVAIGLGIDGDRLDPHAAGGLDDPAGDLAAIGDQNSFEHGAIYLQPKGGVQPCGPATRGRFLSVPSYSKTERRQRFMRPNSASGRELAGASARRKYPSSHVSTPDQPE